MTNACRQPLGWQETFEILIDGISVGTIHGCGSTEIELKHGKHKVRVIGLVKDFENIKYTVASPETENNIEKKNKIIIYPTI